MVFNQGLKLKEEPKNSFDNQKASEEVENRDYHKVVKYFYEKCWDWWREFVGRIG